MQLLLLSPVIFLIAYLSSKFNKKSRYFKSKSSPTKKKVIKTNNKNSNDKGIKKIPYKTGNGLWKIEDFINYTFYNKRNDESGYHPGITIDKINGKRAVIQLTHSARTSGRNNMSILNIDGKSSTSSYINTELKTKTRNNKKNPITDKHVLQTKNVYRTLSEEECHKILNRINSRPSNIDKYNEFINTSRK